MQNFRRWNIYTNNITAEEDFFSREDLMWILRSIQIENKAMPGDHELGTRVLSTAPWQKSTRLMWYRQFQKCEIDSFLYLYSHNVKGQNLPIYIKSRSQLVSLTSVNGSIMWRTTVIYPGTCICQFSAPSAPDMEPLRRVTWTIYEILRFELLNGWTSTHQFVQT